MALFKKKSKKIRKRSFWGNTVQQLKRKKYLFILMIISIFGALFIVGKRGFDRTLGAVEHHIQKVVFAPESLNALRSFDLYADISATLQGKNYYWLKWLGKKEIRTDLITKHPIIDDFVFEHPEPGVLYVTINFHTPELLRQTPTDMFASYDEHLYVVTSGSLLMSGMSALQLPKFSSGREDINGIYRTMSEKELADNISLITKTLSGNNLQEFIYQPGGKRLFVTYKGKRIYFNLQKDLAKQLESLLNLEEHRNGFANVRTIDVGSREEVIVK